MARAAKANLGETFCVFCLRVPQATTSAFTGRDACATEILDSRFHGNDNILVCTIPLPLTSVKMTGSMLQIAKTQIVIQNRL